jgi:hypothetical protein
MMAGLLYVIALCIISGIRVEGCESSGMEGEPLIDEDLAIAGEERESVPK